MKFVCDSCGARYFIDDAKVRGKVLRIRCKKCSHVITVRGPSDVPPSDAERATQAMGAVGEDPFARLRQTLSTDAARRVTTDRRRSAPAAPAAPEPQDEWHYSAAGETFGPYSEDELIERYQQGRIGDETYVWREGFDAWRPAATVPVFATAIDGARAARRKAGGPATMQLSAEDVDALIASRAQADPGPSAAEEAAKKAAEEEAAKKAAEEEAARKAAEEAAKKAAEEEAAKKAAEEAARKAAEEAAKKAAEEAARKAAEEAAKKAAEEEAAKKAAKEEAARKAAEEAAKKAEEEAAKKAAEEEAAKKAEEEEAKKAEDEAEETRLSTLRAQLRTRRRDRSATRDASPSVPRPRPIGGLRDRLSPADDAARSEEPTGQVPAVSEADRSGPHPAALETTTDSSEPLATTDETPDALSSAAPPDDAPGHDDLDAHAASESASDVGHDASVADDEPVGDSVAAGVEALAPVADDGADADGDAVAEDGADAVPAGDGADAQAEAEDPDGEPAAADAEADDADDVDAPDASAEPVDEDETDSDAAAALAVAAPSDTPVTPHGPIASEPVPMGDAAKPTRTGAWVALAGIVILVVIGIAIGPSLTSSNTTTDEPDDADTEAGETAEAEPTDDEPTETDAPAVDEASLQVAMLRSGRRVGQALDDARAAAATVDPDALAVAVSPDRAQDGTTTPAGNVAAATNTSTGEASAVADDAAQAADAAPTDDDGTPQRIAIGGGSTTARGSEGLYGQLGSNSIAGPSIRPSLTRDEPEEQTGPGADHFASGLSSFVQQSIQRCHQRHVGEEGSFPMARVELELTVQPNGRVSDVSVARQLSGTPFERCLQSHRERWTFGPFAGDPVTLRRPYVLQ